MSDQSQSPILDLIPGLGEKTMTMLVNDEWFSDRMIVDLTRKDSEFLDTTHEVEVVGVVYTRLVEVVERSGRTHYYVVAVCDVDSEQPVPTIQEKTL